MNQFKKFTLSNTNSKKNFNCKWSFSGLKIKSIQVPTLSKIKESEWTGLLRELSIKITSISTDLSSHSYHLILLLTEDQRHPIFVFDDFFPIHNNNNITSYLPFDNKVEFELINPQNVDLEIDIIYVEYLELF